jgi:hypothetical protein
MISKKINFISTIHFETVHLKLMCFLKTHKEKVSVKKLQESGSQPNVLTRVTMSICWCVEEF